MSSRPFERLLADGEVVVGAGVMVEDGRPQGVEAVIDEDLTAALLATETGADELVLVRDVPFVERDWGSPRAAAVDRATPRQLRLPEFAPGSMGRKIEAACRFVESPERGAAIGALDAVVDGRAGMRVVAHPLRRASARRTEQLVA